MRQNKPSKPGICRQLKQLLEIEMKPLGNQKIAIVQKIGVIGKGTDIAPSVFIT